MCILSGCDFLAGLQGIGVRKAHGYVRKYKGFVKVWGAFPRELLTHRSASSSMRRLCFTCSDLTSGQGPVRGCSADGTHRSSHMLQAGLHQAASRGHAFAVLQPIEGVTCLARCPTSDHQAQLWLTGTALMRAIACSCSRCCGSAACPSQPATKPRSSARCGLSGTAGKRGECMRCIACA